MGAVDAGEAELAVALRDLMFQWEETADHWRDASRRQFAAAYLEDLGDISERAVSAMMAISDLLRRMQRECQVHEGQA